MRLIRYSNCFTGDAKLDLDRKKLKVFEDEKRIEMSKMSHLKELGVDLTSYLVAQQRVPDKHYKFDNTSSQKDNCINSGTKTEFQTPIQVHLHESEL